MRVFEATCVGTPSSSNVFIEVGIEVVIIPLYYFLTGSGDDPPIAAGLKV